MSNKPNSHILQSISSYSIDLYSIRDFIEYVFHKKRKLTDLAASCLSRSHVLSLFYGFDENPAHPATLWLTGRRRQYQEQQRTSRLFMHQPVSAAELRWSVQERKIFTIYVPFIEIVSLLIKVFSVGLWASQPKEYKFCCVWNVYLNEPLLHNFYNKRYYCMTQIRRKKPYSNWNDSYYYNLHICELLKDQQTFRTSENKKGVISSE